MDKAFDDMCAAHDSILDTQAARIAELRSALIESVKALGGYAANDVSDGFLTNVPDEIAMKLKKAEAQCAVLRSALEQALARIVEHHAHGHIVRFAVSNECDLCGDGLLARINQALTSTTAGADLEKKAAMSDQLAKALVSINKRTGPLDWVEYTNAQAALAEYDALNAPKGDGV